MTFRAVRALLRASILAAALLVAGLATGIATVHADAVDDAVKALVDLEKAGNEAGFLSKMQEFKDSNDPRVLGALRGIAASSNDKIACAAIRQVTSRKDPKFVVWLRSKVGDKNLYTREKGGRPEVYKCVLEALAAYRDPGALKALAEVEEEFVSSDAEYSTLVIRAYGSVPQKPVVAQLIAWAGELDISHGGKSSGGRGGKVQYGAEAQKIRDRSAQVLVETLVALTDEDLGDAAAWKKWWTEKSGSFTFPEPDRLDKSADVTKLAEWTDTRYRYKVLRPEGKGWSFQPGGEWFRIQLQQMDTYGFPSISVGWNIFNTTVMTIKTVPEYANWWMYEQFPKVEFADFDAGGSAVSQDRNIRGTDWTIVSAKGKGKGSMASWGPMERRVYITKLDHRFLYAWVVVKQSVSAEDKQKAWDAVERTIFSPR